MPSALEILKAKLLTATDLDTAGILARWPQRLREQALFSARMTLQGYLERLKTVLVQVAEGRLDESAARLALRAKLAELGYVAPGEGLKDAANQRRLDLILRTNRQTAASMAQIARSEDPVMLLRFPAWELVSGGWRRNHRTDWPARWRAAGEAVGWQGAHRIRMAALKTSPIWKALGQGAGGFKDTLGNPYPPFAFGSSYEWDELSLTEAKALGLLPKVVRNRVAANSAETCRAQDPATCRYHHPELAKIKEGRKEPCSLEAASDLLNRGFSVEGCDGRQIRFDRFVRDHYERGLRRQGNRPDPERLRLLPVAVYAVRRGERSLKFARGTTPDYVNPPKGTQAVYSVPYGKGILRVFVYADSGKVSGWFVAK